MPDKARVPDVVGDDNRLQMLNNALLSVQQGLFDLRLRQTIEGAADSDPSGHLNVAGQAVSYADRARALADAEQRLVAEHPDLAARLVEVIAARGRA